MTFEYLQRVVIDASLEIEDIGNCAIIGRNDFGEEFYFLTRTYDGETECIEYGPCQPDVNLLPTSVYLKYDRWIWNQPKLEKRINMFLNDPKKGISQADNSTYALIKSLIKNPVDNVLIDIIPDEELEENDY